MTLSEAVTHGSWFGLVPCVIFLPILGLLVNMVFGRRGSERLVGLVASGAIGLAFLVSLLQAVGLASHPEGTTVVLADWIVIGSLRVPWAIKVDTLSVTMMLMVTGVSALIHVYAIGYMREDVRFQGDPGRFTRFFVYFNLFVAAMMILVTGDNYLMLFVGWEGVGLCSYLLIGFWFEKGRDGLGNALAGKKAFIVNRIGDFGFLIAIFLTFRAFGSLRFDEVFAKAEAMGPGVAGVITLITVFLLIGATGKSAQLPLYVWLPDAMAGPTPVSALIHAATMVTAGVYMIARSHVLFDLAPFSANLVALVGAATALFAATIAVGQFDIKRVLAYSTISQLGFMVAAVGLGAYVAGMFHLVTHAFFKALLFLSAGSVIQGVERGHHLAAEHLDIDPPADHVEAAFDPNDMRYMGGLWSKMKTTFVAYVVGAVALAGIPPLAGFFSKDEILAEASRNDLLVYVLLTVAAFLTAFYMGRQIWMVFIGQPRSGASAHAQESPLVMTGPLVGLAVLSLVGGALNLPGVHSLGRWLGHTLGELEAGDFSVAVAMLSVGLAIVAVAFSWLAYGKRPLRAGETDPLSRVLGPVFVGMTRKWCVDEFYDWLVVRRYVALARYLGEIVDGRFWHDWFHDVALARTFRQGTHWLAESFDLPIIDGAAIGLGNLTQSLASRMRRIESGYVRRYAVSIFLGAVVLLGYFLILR